MRELDGQTPVLVAAGTATQRVEDWRDAAEPLTLMLHAVQNAASSGPQQRLLRKVGRIAVPHGRWEYRDPGRWLAQQVGAESAITVLAEVGILQQSLIADVCARVASGEIQAGLVIGGDAGHRLRLAQVAEQPVRDTRVDDEPDVVLQPQAELKHPVELAVGLDRAVGYYAILESAIRYAAGRGVSEAQHRMAVTYSRFSEIAAANPDAWRRVIADEAAIRVSSARNPMMAFPYTRAVTTSWSVDQAAALLICSAASARAACISEDRWIFPWVSAESNYMQSVVERAELSRSVGAAAVCEQALAHADLPAQQIDLADLYSCFPSAVDTFAEAIGLPAQVDRTVTGGMPSAGGPYNNYVLQSTVRMAQLLGRSSKSAHGVVTCVSGLLTKQAAAVWSNRPSPTGFAHIDVTDQAARAARSRTIIGDHDGAAKIAGYTVLHRADGPRAIIVADIGDSRRTMAFSEQPAIVASMESQEWCQREVHIHGQQFEVPA